MRRENSRSEKIEKKGRRTMKQPLERMSKAAQEYAQTGIVRSHEDRVDPLRDHTPGHLGYSRENLREVRAKTEHVKRAKSARTKSGTTARKRSGHVSKSAARAKSMSTQRRGTH